MHGITIRNSHCEDKSCGARKLKLYERGGTWNKIDEWDLPDPRQYDTVPLLHFDFDVKKTEKLKFEFTEWWNNEDSNSGPALQYLKIHSISFGSADKFQASNALQPAFCDAIDLDSLGYPSVGASNIWLSAEEGHNAKNYLKFDLGCDLIINFVKVQITVLLLNRL